MLEIENLTVAFAMRGSDVTALDSINLKIAAGERVGLVGESGAGKSVLGYSIINLISKPGYIASGHIRFDGVDITTMTQTQLRALRGNQIAMIFQDPMVTLNPVLTIRQQMDEVFYQNKQMTRDEKYQAMLAALRKVYIPSPEKRLENYPHELSGGMRQRVIIAIALLQSPKLIIADEPTTALDVTVQAEIIALLVELCAQDKVGLILITHDLGIVSLATDTIAVLYAGRIIEMGATAQVIERPMHPYTRGLIASLPQSVHSGDRLHQIPGSMPTLGALPSGCTFHPRCGHALPQCREQEPALIAQESRLVRCNNLEAYL